MKTPTYKLDSMLGADILYDDALIGEPVEKISKVINKMDGVSIKHSCDVDESGFLKTVTLKVDVSSLKKKAKKKGYGNIDFEMAYDLWGSLGTGLYRKLKGE